MFATDLFSASAMLWDFTCKMPGPYRHPLGVNREGLKVPSGGLRRGDFGPFLRSQDHPKRDQQPLKRPHATGECLGKKFCSRKKNDFAPNSCSNRPNSPQNAPGNP